MPHRKTIANATLNVPSKFSSVSDALDHARNLSPNPGVEVVINLESGYKWDETVVVSEEDLSYVRITSADDTVEVDSGFSSTEDHNPLLLVTNHAEGPSWDIYVDCGPGTVGRSIRVTNGASLFVYKAKGTRGAVRGLEVSRGAVASGNGDLVLGSGPKFDGHSDRNVSVTSGGAAYLTGLSAPNAGSIALRVGDSSIASVRYIDASNSSGRAIRTGGITNANNGDFSGAGSSSAVVVTQGYFSGVSGDFTGTAIGVDALQVLRGSVLIDSADLSNAGRHAVNVLGPGIVSMDNATFADPTEIGIRVGGPGLVFGGGLGIINAGTHAIVAFGGAKVFLPSATITDPTFTGIFATGPCQVVVGGVTISGAGGEGVRADTGIVDVSGGSVTGSGSRDLRVDKGGQIYATGCTTSDSAGSQPDIVDTVLDAFNLTRPRGVIWNEDDDEEAAGVKKENTWTEVQTFEKAPETDRIDERTADAGVTIDGVLLKDDKVDPGGLPAATAAELGAVLQAAAVADLDEVISDPPTQAEVQAISDKVDELLVSLRTAGVLAT